MRRCCQKTWLDLNYETALAFFLDSGEPDDINKDNKYMNFY
jgi:hypothetical protein